MLKGLGDLAALMKQAQQMQQRVGEMQEALGKVRVEGIAGGGMVRVTATGQQRLVSCQIDQSLWESGDREMVEQLVLAAANQALEKSRQAAAEELAKLTGGLQVPGLSEALSKLGLGG
ncbi:MAG: YbaB/EbfC family nucleoid-associated protein [Planctomycetes bacterium]|nr:YbaB/EbfC family nucleoid-associated protein [Planctomycetota bacterium]